MFTNKIIKKSLKNISSHIFLINHYYNNYKIFYLCQQNFSKKKEINSLSKKEQVKTKEKEIKSKINEEYQNISPDDLVTKYHEKVKEIINVGKEELAKMMTVRVSPKMFESMLVVTKNQKALLSEISSISMKGANIVNIQPFDAAHKEQIIKTLQTTKLDLQISSEGQNIVVIVGNIPKDLKLELTNKLKRMESGVKEEIKKIKQVVSSEFKKLEKILGKDEINRLEKRVYDNFDKEQKVYDKSYKLKFDEINSS